MCSCSSLLNLRSLVAPCAALHYVRAAFRSTCRTNMATNKCTDLLQTCKVPCWQQVAFWNVQRGNVPVMQLLHPRENFQCALPSLENGSCTPHLWLLLMTTQHLHALRVSRPYPPTTCSPAPPLRFIAQLTSPPTTTCTLLLPCNITNMQVLNRYSV